MDSGFRQNDGGYLMCGRGIRQYEGWLGYVDSGFRPNDGGYLMCGRGIRQYEGWLGYVDSGFRPNDGGDQVCVVLIFSNVKAGWVMWILAFAGLTVAT